jgi:hypothetical protein
LSSEVGVSVVFPGAIVPVFADRFMQCQFCPPVVIIPGPLAQDKGLVQATFVVVIELLARNLIYLAELGTTISWSARPEPVHV